MKIPFTLSLIIGSSLGVVSAQQITADVRYTIAIDGVSDSYYALSCSDPNLYSNHPMNGDACFELSLLVEKAKASQKTTATALHNALDPAQTIDDPSPCVVRGGEATLNIFFGEVNNEIITQGNAPGYLNLRYPNGCVMKTIAEQANLAHLIPFYGLEGVPMAPLN